MQKNTNSTTKRGASNARPNSSAKAPKVFAAEKEILRLFKKGMKPLEISKFLNKEKIKTVRGHLWTASNVSSKIYASKN